LGVGEPHFAQSPTPLLFLAYFEWRCGSEDFDELQVAGYNKRVN